MSQQVCPLCSANIEGDDPHIYKHFKYKRFDCGDKACNLLFYTETERNAHCTETKHKRSFQKTTNPYMENMIAMIVEDAKELASEDMETVCKNRFGDIKKKKKSDLFKKRVIPPAPPSSESAPGTSESSSTTPQSATSSSAAAKKRNGAETTSTPATKRTKSGATSSSVSPATSSNDSAHCTTDNQLTSSTTSQPTSPAQEVVDSTTSDATPPVPKQPRKKRDSAAGNSAKADEDAAALERIAGVGDDYSTDKRDLVEVACELCKEKIPYLYFVRRLHAEGHMPKTVAKEEHEDILKAEMDRCFPDGPNDKLACQACNDNKKIRNSNRREHIEYNHHSILPELRCPVDGCNKPFRRQCELAPHMREMHNKIVMCTYKDEKFQESRKRRNRMIGELRRRCFPWSEVEENAKSEAKAQQAPENPALGSVSAHIRIREANKTRRLQQYDSDSSDDDDDESTPSVTADAEADESTTDNQQINQADLEIIEVFWKKTINDQISRPVQVKQEPVDDVAEGVVSSGEASSAPIAPTVRAFRVKQEVEEEEPKEERFSSIPMHPPLPPPTLQTHRLQLMHPPPPPPSFMSQYQPIVPPPLGSPESMISRTVSPFCHARILSPVRAPERQGTPRKSRSRSPIRSSRERITFDNGRGNERGRRYNNRQNDSNSSTSNSNYRHFNPQYRAPSSRGSNFVPSSHHSNSNFQRVPYRPPRNYSNDGNRDRSNHSSRGYNNTSSHSSTSSNWHRRDNESRH